MVAVLLTRTLLLVFAVVVNPVAASVTTPLTKHVGRSLTNVVEGDQQRACALLNKALGVTCPYTLHRGINSPAENVNATAYIAFVGVGSPPTTYNLLVDTGSSNTWVGATQPYVITNTSIQTGFDVGVLYGSGNFSGIEYFDHVTISPSLVIPSQSIGVANVSQGFQGFDGILGIGPTILTQGTLFPPINNSILIPTVTDNLFSLDVISKEVIGILFAPDTNSSGIDANGEITWGGVNCDKCTSDITYAPVTDTFPSSSFWGFNLSLSYGEIPLLSNSAGFLDTGTTLFLINTNAYNLYQNITGAVYDPINGLLSITPSQYSNLESLYFHLPGTESLFELTPNAQILPRQLNSLFNGTADGIYLVVNDIGNVSAGVGFVFGQACLERFYSVYDTGNRRVGLATTVFTYATTN